MRWRAVALALSIPAEKGWAAFTQLAAKLARYPTTHTYGCIVFVCRRNRHCNATRGGGQAGRTGEGKVKSVKMNGQTKRARGTETEESHSVSTTWDHKGKERKNCSLV